MIKAAFIENNLNFNTFCNAFYEKPTKEFSVCTAHMLHITVTILYMHSVWVSPSNLKSPGMQGIFLKRKYMV